MKTLGRGKGISVWLAVYAVCVVFVCSFIVFEVLDVDGSDFPVTPTKMAMKLTEPSQDHVRRALLAAPVQLPVKTMVAVLDRSGGPGRLESRAAQEPRWAGPLRGSWITLPRVSLSDVPEVA